MDSAALDSKKFAVDPWRQWRDRMPIAQAWAYFDHAAVAPLSQPAADLVTRYAHQASHLGDTVWPQWNNDLGRLRTGAAELLNCDRGDVFFVPNTTTGINLVAEGWDWQPGDNVVIPSGEFPSNLFPWLNQQTRGVEVRTVERRGSVVSIDDLMDHCDDSTRIIAASWVGYATGYRLDVNELVRRAHDRGVLVFLDAIQGLGIYPLDLQQTPVDFLAADGHKWLLGPEGAGVAMIRREHLGRIRCGNVGWASVKNSHNYADPQLDLRDDATRFESGSFNMVGAGALAVSIDMFLEVKRQHGPDAISERILSLCDDLERKLKTAGATTMLVDDPKHRSGIVTFQIPDIEPAAFRSAAADAQVAVSCRGGGVRASVHAYNDLSDIDRLVAVIARIRK